MAGTPTTNYALPTYADADAPDLTGAYNSAMTEIDAQMKKNADVAASASSAASTASSTASTAKSTADSAKSTADSALSKANANATDIASLEEEVAGFSASSFNPQSTDKSLTVAQLSEAKVTANGIVYFKPVS